jgi:hypothetical protein
MREKKDKKIKERRVAGESYNTSPQLSCVVKK